MSDMKYFEVRDRATCMAVLAIRIEGDTKEEKAIAAWGGHKGFVFLIDLSTPRMERSPIEWGAQDRTHSTAHRYIETNWHLLETGSVVDVEFILGESVKPKKPSWEENK